MKRLLLVILLLCWCSPTDAADPRQLSWTLDYGPAASWPEAISELSNRPKGIPAQAAASVLRRQQVMTGAARVAMVKALGARNLTLDPRVLDFLHREASYGRPDSSKAALDGLLNSSNPAAAGYLLQLFSSRDDSTKERKAIAKRLAEIIRLRAGSAIHGAGGGSFFPHEAAVLAAADAREPLVERFFGRLADHSDRELRYLAADQLRYAIDRRGDELLWQLSQDLDKEIAQKALWSLGRRRDIQACDLLLERTWHVGRPTPPSTTELGDLAEVCAPTHLFIFYQLAETARPDQRQTVEIFLDKATRWDLLPLLDETDFRAQLESYRLSADPAIRQSVAWLLDKKSEIQRKRLIGQRPALLGPAVLILFALVSALLGLVLFAWGFRLLQLLRLLQRTAPAKVRSVHQGTALLRGRLKLAGDRVQHPVTEESCLYYAGADRDHPHQQFFLEDDTGRILVNPAGAVLLSADGFLTENAEVVILGTVDRSSGTERQNVIGKPQLRRSLFERCVHFLVQGVLGSWSRTGTGMALFSDPRRCFWIWDDHGNLPLQSGREVVRLLLIFLAAGIWISLFAATALVMFDQQFSAVLAGWLNLVG
jgi:hypothetical protein